MRTLTFFRPKSHSLTLKRSLPKGLKLQLESIGKKLMSRLSEIRIVEGGRLSITNFVALAITMKVVFASSPTFVHWLLLLTVLTAYNYKRWATDKKQTANSSLESRFKELENSISQLKSAITLKR
jgi:hypothetical protein